jgi:acyl-CoA thioesterase
MPENFIARLWARCGKEPYRRLLGIEVLELKPGYARVAMHYRPAMQNIFGIMHGGAVFSLVDEAFQLACNARGEVAVAQQVNIYFLATASPGARLVAEAVEQNATRKTALYDISVFEQDEQGRPGRRLSSAQALAYRKGGSLPFDDNGELCPPSGQVQQPSKR